MLKAPTIVLMMDIKTRLPRLTEEYTGYPPELIKESIFKIRKRLGGNNTSNALRAVDTGRLSEAVEITLRYYDKAYMFGIGRRYSDNIVYVETDTDNIRINAEKVLEAAAGLSL